MKFIVTLEEGMNGYIVAECPQIPGCMSQGKTKEDALANIQDAIGACLEVMVEDMSGSSRDGYCITAQAGKNGRPYRQAV